jgi:hypothetical protein
VRIDDKSIPKDTLDLTPCPLSNQKLQARSIDHLIGEGEEYLRGASPLLAGYSPYGVGENYGLSRK